MTSKPASTKKVSVLPHSSPRVGDNRNLQSGGVQITPDRKVLEAAGSVSDAIERIKSMVVKAEGFYRAVLNFELAQACGVAEFLMENREEWSDFCRNPVWSNFLGRKPREDDTSKALLFVLVRIFPIQSQKVGKRASKFYNALARYVHEKVPVTEIPAKIKAAHGIGNLALKNARRASIQNGPPVHRPKRLPAERAVTQAVGETKVSDTSSTEPAAASDDYLQFCTPIDGKSKAILDSPKPCLVMLSAELVPIGKHRFAMALMDIVIFPRKSKKAA